MKKRLQKQLHNLRKYRNFTIFWKKNQCIFIFQKKIHLNNKKPKKWNKGCNLLKKNIKFVTCLFRKIIIFAYMLQDITLRHQTHQKFTCFNCYSCEFVWILLVYLTIYEKILGKNTVLKPFKTWFVFKIKIYFV